MSRKAMTLRLGQDQAKELEAIARAEGTSVSDAVRDAIAEHIERRRRDPEFKARLQRIMEEDRAQYLTVGIQLGERYENSPIIWPDGTEAPPDTWDSYTPVDRPGARAPHFWLAAGRALYDEFAKGFTLIDFGVPDGARALAAAALARGVPIETLRLEPTDGLYRAKLVLVRPDQHIAWHGDAVADATAIIDRVRGA